MKLKLGWRLGALIAAVVTTAALAPSALAGAVITNGTVALGVNDHGQLNFSDGTRFVGVTYEPTGNDGTRAGCECEGWGAGAGGPTQFQGRANDNLGGASNLSLVSFTSTATTATSVADVLRSGSAALRVTHEFEPSPATPNLYEITITLKNVTPDTLTNVRYERLMDWDVEPTAFDEFVTINRGSTPPSDLIYSDDNGFGDNFPFTSKTGGNGPLDPSTVNANYTDKGPTDHGARFTFDFGSLAPDAEKTFVLFYGAAGTEVAANSAVSAAALEMFSYGQPNTANGPTLGEPNTFIWGFAAVGGTPVIPPTLALTPETATNTVGESHTVTAELKDSAGNPVPGASIVFEVSGANPQPAATRTTGADGKATFTYTGTNAGGDVITACLDGNGNGACDVGEVTDTAAKTWEAGQPSDTTDPSCELTGTGTDSTGKKFIEVTAEDDESGIASILVTKSTNANTVVPPFTPGTTDPVVVRATKINNSKSSSVELRVTDVAGNVTVCDPVITLVVREAGKPESQTHTGIPAIEHNVLIENGNPGLNRLDVTVNGHTWKLTGLKAGQVSTLDVASAMNPGTDNTITLTAYGKPGASALVVISD
ncbi:MAG: Ig-like domain-containing protein [Gaiellaceae bacterium]